MTRLLLILPLLLALAAATPQSAQPVVPAASAWSGAPHVPGGIQPALGEVRESAVGWHPYPDPVPGGAPPLPTVRTGGIPERANPVSALDPRIGREGDITATWSGEASWYDDGPGFYGAVHTYRWGDKRYTVRVCRRDAKNTCVLVTVRDHMANPVRAIDLSPDAFARLWPGISREDALYLYGVVQVVVETGMPDARITPPPTDSEVVK